MSKQVNELKARVEWLENELSAKMDSADELYNELQTYKNREKAIIGALTEAQNSSARVLEEAREKAAGIIAAANEEAALQKERMKLAIDDANLRADAIIRSAQEKAAAIYEESDKLLEDRKAELAGLNKRINAVAKYAADLCRSFSESIVAGMDKEAGETAPVPEEYATTKELMQSIYALEGRELPVEDAANAENGAQPMESELSAMELTGLLDTLNDNAEEKLLTVDDIPETGNGPSGDAELDAILNDILKED